MTPKKGFLEARYNFCLSLYFGVKFLTGFVRFTQPVFYSLHILAALSGFTASRPLYAGFLDIFLCKLRLESAQVCINILQDLVLSF